MAGGKLGALGNVVGWIHWGYREGFGKGLGRVWGMGYGHWWIRGSPYLLGRGLDVFRKTFVNTSLSSTN